MATILYIFPHPDDESFGPAPAIAHQVQRGDEVHLLTLTKGGATRMRHKYSLSVEEMGEVREKELTDVAKVLGIKSLTVLDFPDSQLKFLDPRSIEKSVAQHIDAVRPDIVVTYAVYGVSGFHDHLVTHAVVKRVFCEMRESRKWLKRLAFFTLASTNNVSGIHSLQCSKEEEVQVRIQATHANMSTFHQGLDCYTTYQEVIEQSGIHDIVTNTIAFELFDEQHADVLGGLHECLP